MRLFTGIAISPDALRRVAEILTLLRPSAKLKWAPLSNLHITSAFIGAWPEERLAELQSALSKVEVKAPIPITITGFGFFPNPHQPHSFFLAVRREPSLEDLAGKIGAALESLGRPREERAYTPHITLARIARRENITELRQTIASMNTQFPLETFAAEEFHLYESRNPGTGSVYSKLATFALRKEAAE